MSSTHTPKTIEDPVAYFLEDLTYHGKTERTRTAYERVLRRFESSLDEETTPADATHRDCMAFVHSLRGDLAESTVATYAAYVHRFYGYMTELGAFTGNPMTLVIEEMDETVEERPRTEGRLAAGDAGVRLVYHPPTSPCRRLHAVENRSAGR